MTDNKPEGTEPRISIDKSGWIQRRVLGAVCVLVIAVYAFGAQSGSLELMSLNAADTYYNLLVQGFRAGHLSLKKEPPPGLTQLVDPYDPAANARYRPASDPMVDMSYYKGRLYLYFGVTPALILFWPFVALTGHYLFHRQAVAIFCAVGLLASAGLLRALWRRYFAEVSVGVVAACVLALGLATGLPVLLTRSEVYEVPISCGYMLVMLTLGAIWRALHEPKPRKVSVWLAVASLLYGLAVGARPSLLFGAVILLVPVVQARRERRPIAVLLMAATGPIIIIGLGLMLYNALRFENPFEFGLRYELGPARMDTHRFFSLPYLWFNLRVYFLEPVRWSGRFPFVHNKIVVPPLPSGRGEVETAFGVLTNIPLVWLSLAAPLAWRGRSASDRSRLRGFLAVVALVFGVDALVLCLFRGANFRYEVEFLPALMLLAVVGIFGLERGLAPLGAGRAPNPFGADGPVWRRVARWGWVLLLGFSVVFNVLVAAVNYAEAQNYMGTALLRTGKIQEAMRHYELALRVKPDLPEAHNNLGAGLLRMGKLGDAVEHLEQSLRIDPDAADAHYNLGRAFERLGRVKEAIGEYEQVLRINPDDDEAHNRLGLICEHLGKLEDAIVHYEQALRINRDYAEAHYNLGVALEHMGRVQEAVGQYEQAVRINPNFAEAKKRLERFPVVR